MKQKNILSLVLVCAVAALISFFVAGKIFSPQKYSTKVPTIAKMDPTFPDVKNDPAYSSWLNPKALDLTVPVSIGTNQNKDPFSGGQ